MLEAKAWIRCLHSSANEFRAYREYDTEKSKKQELNLKLELSKLVLSICNRGFLGSVSGIAQLIAKANADSTGITAAFVFRSIVGYCEVQYDFDEVISISSFSSSDTHDTATPFLAPSILGKDYAFVLKRIYDGLLVDAEIEKYMKSEEPERFKENSRFEILGYYATACELLADVIEDEAKQIKKSVSKESEPEQSNGLGNGLSNSLTESELTSALSQIITDKNVRWTAKQLKPIVVANNPGRIASKASIEKNPIYQRLLELQGRKRAGRAIKAKALETAVSRQAREMSVENGVRIRGRKIDSRD